MAFIRVYQAQGDPKFRFSTMRAGRLIHAKMLSAMRARRGSAKRRRAVLHAGDTFHAHQALRYSLAAGDPFHRAMRMPAGDPFRLRLPKFIRKASLKKAIKGVGFAASGLVGLVKQALPVAGPIVAGMIGGAPLAAAAATLFQQHQEPPAQGPASVVSSTYGPPAPPDTSLPSMPYQGARSRMNVPEDTGEDTGEEDTGEDAGEDTGEDTGEETP